MKRRRLNRKQSRRNFSRGNRVNRRNIKMPVTQRGGYRI